MYKKYNKKFHIILSFFFFLLSLVIFTKPVSALKATVGFSGNSSVKIGDNITIKMYVSNVSEDAGGIVSVGGNLSFDSTYLEYVSGTGATSPYSFDITPSADYIIAGLDTTLSKGIKSQTTVFTFVFKTKKIGSTTITFKNAKVSDADTQITPSISAKTISITEPPSTNNFLKSLSVDKGSISFNKNTTTYSVSVASDVDSITINASAEDSKAKVSGTGTKKLDYGNNKIEVVVTAASGDKKTYTITVNRKDIRSSNNNLSSLKVGSGELSPKFNKKTTSYTLSVPYEVEDLKVTATAEDSKAKVTVSGNNNLVSEKTKDVTITVTAENGSKKTYTIKVTRGKDPNKKLSDNNYLKSLTASAGMLSPEFDKDTTNYSIYLPYEVDKITFDYEVEDTTYATVKFEGKENLQPGISNIFKIKVTSESEEERVYTISVNRANATNTEGSSNTYLKSIELEDGKLTKKFDKDVREYYYKRGKNFSIKEVLPEDELSAVSTFEDGNTIYFIVSSSNGEYGVYTLREKESSIIPYIINITILIGGVALGYITHTIVRKRNMNRY